MSKIFTLPHQPIQWGGSPHDFSFSGASHSRQLAHQAQETVQRYIPGTRYLTWDGRVYRYSYAIADSIGGMGASNWSKVVNISEDASAIAIGDQFITILLGGGDGFGEDGAVAENELAGGYLVIHHPSVQVRGITGNTGGDTVKIRVHLDAPISVADADPLTEILLNPYLYLKQTGAGSLYNSVMCVPNNNIDSGNFFWGQTYGPCWVNPGVDWDSIGDTAYERTVYFAGDGSVNGAIELSGDAGGEQHAGFIIDQTAAGSDALPFIMLQISI